MIQQINIYLILINSLSILSYQTKIAQRTFTNQQQYFFDDVKVDKGNNYFYIDIENTPIDLDRAIPGALYIGNTLSDAILNNVNYYISSTCSDTCKDSTFTTQPSATQNCWPTETPTISSKSITMTKQEKKLQTCKIAINIYSVDNTPELDFVIALYPFYRINDHYGTSLNPYELFLFWGTGIAPRYLDLVLNSPIKDLSHVKAISIEIDFNQKEYINNVYMGTDNPDDDCLVKYPSSANTCLVIKTQIKESSIGYKFLKQNVNLTDIHIYAAIDLKNTDPLIQRNITIKPFYSIQCDDNYNFDEARKDCLLSSGTVPEFKFLGTETQVAQYYYQAYVRPVHSKKQYINIHATKKIDAQSSAVPGILYLYDEASNLNNIKYYISSSCNSKCTYAQYPTKQECPDTEIYKSNEIVWVRQDKVNEDCQISIAFDLTDSNKSYTYFVDLYPILLVDEQFLEEKYWVQQYLLWEITYVPLYIKLEYPFTSFNNIASIENTLYYQITQDLQKVYVGYNIENKECNLQFPDTNEKCLCKNPRTEEGSIKYFFNLTPNSGQELNIYLALYSKLKDKSKSNTIDFNVIFQIQCQSGYGYFDTADKNGCYSTSKICQSGTYYDKETQECEKCVQFCQTCYNESSCDKCEDGYQLKNNVCILFSNILKFSGLFVYFLLIILY